MKTTRNILVTICVIFSLVGCSAIQWGKTKRLYDEALKMEKSGDFLNAVDRYEEVVSRLQLSSYWNKSIFHGQVLTRLGMIMGLLGKDKIALTLLEEGRGYVKVDNERLYQNLLFSLYIYLWNYNLYPEKYTDMINRLEKLSVGSFGKFSDKHLDTMMRRLLNSVIKSDEKGYNSLCKSVNSCKDLSVQYKIITEYIYAFHDFRSNSSEKEEKVIRHIEKAAKMINSNYVDNNNNSCCNDSIAYCLYDVSFLSNNKGDPDFSKWVIVSGGRFMDKNDAYIHYMYGKLIKDLEKQGVYVLTD